MVTEIWTLEVVVEKEGVYDEGGNEIERSWTSSLVQRYCFRMSYCFLWSQLVSAFSASTGGKEYFDFEPKKVKVGRGVQ